MYQQLKIGILGFGSIVQNVHFNTLRKLNNVAISAIADSNPEHLKIAGSLAPDAVLYSDYDELLKQSDTDVVLICLPNHMHCDSATTTLSLGKHVYLEKPIASNLSDGSRVLESSYQSQSRCMVGFNFRFNALHQLAKEKIGSDMIGAINNVRTIFSSSLGASSDWKKSRATGGGVLLDLGSHHIDLMRYLFNVEISDVRARVWSVKTEEDNAELELRLTNGTEVHSYFSRSSSDQDLIEIYGARGTIKIDRFNAFNLDITTPGETKTRLGQFTNKLSSIIKSPLLLDRFISPKRERSYEVAMAHFIDAIINNKKVSPNLKDGYRSLQVIHAAEESAKTGNTVQVSVD